MLLIVDTCQAASMYEKLYSPNVIAAASSLVGEDSLSHHVDHSIGVYIIDRYPYYILEYLEKVQPNTNRTLQEFLNACPKRKCISTVGVRYDLLPKTPSKIRVTDFLGSVRNIDYLTEIYDALHVKNGKKQISGEVTQAPRTT
uniref:GPI-anchor transamidase n=1 Tax=Romanomermis culicivorax TaxID=13658 RepID=A0A915KS31_ROMCU